MTPKRTNQDALCGFLICEIAIPEITFDSLAAGVRVSCQGVRQTVLVQLCKPLADVLGMSDDVPTALRRDDRGEARLIIVEGVGIGGDHVQEPLVSGRAADTLYRAPAAGFRSGCERGLAAVDCGEGRNDFILGECEQFVGADFPELHPASARLVDVQDNAVDVRKALIGPVAQRIDANLAVSDSLDVLALAVFQVADIERPAADPAGVAGAELPRQPVTQIDADFDIGGLRHFPHPVDAGLQMRCHVFGHREGEPVCAHHATDEVVWIKPEIEAHFPDLVRHGAFGCIDRGAVWGDLAVFGQPVDQFDRGGAGHPPIRR